MTINTLSRRKITGLLLAASIFSSAVIAQDADRIGRPGRLPVLPCCKCLGETTTTNLSTGAVPWTASLPGSPAQGGTALAANVAWTTMLAPLAQWISPAGNPQTVGVYNYQTQFDARRCSIQSEIVVTGKFLADNSATLLIDGNKVISSQGTPNYGFLPGSLTPFSYVIPAGSAAGIHTVTVQATNSSGPTGIVVQLTATRKCSDKVEKGDRDDRQD
jgi:hypothetical protein